MINAHKHRRKQYAMSKGFTPLECDQFQSSKSHKKKYNNFIVSMNYLFGKRSLTGFTIIEILTVLVIVVIIGYSISLLMTQVITSYTKIKAEQEIINSY